MFDGGDFLRKIPWVKGLTYLEISKSYRNYVLSKYGEAIVVFDGYDLASTKDQQR